jgi:protein SCO1/2
MKTTQIFILAFIALLTSSCSSSYKSSNNVTGSDLIGGSFVMEDHEGKKVTEKDFKGQYTLVFFGFTSCPTVCPMGLSTMGRVLHRLPKKISNQIQPVFVSVDPQRDTGEKMQKFTKSFYKGMVTLKGTMDQTKDMVFKYRGYYKKTYENGEDEYLVDHSDIIYLMSKEGKYMAHFSSSTGVENIKKRIQKLIK